MQETRRELVDRILGFNGELHDADARVVVELAVNDAVQQIWLEHAFRDFELPDPYLLNLVAGTRSYLLPAYFGRIASKDSRLRNLTSGAWIGPTTGADLYREHPSAGSALDTARSDPSQYFIAGKTSVAVQPGVGAGDELEVLSSDAADVDVVVSLEGTDATGAWTSAQFQLNGTTAVAVGTWAAPLNTFGKSYVSSVDPFTPYTSSRGTVILRKVGGATLQTLYAQESAREAFQITFDRLPSRAVVIAIPILRAPRRLWHDGDVLPAMWGPAVFEEVLINYRVNTGELENGGNIPRPRLTTLIAYDNESRAGGRVGGRIRPFTG